MVHFLISENDDVFHYLVEDQGRILYVGNEIPDEYKDAELIDMKGCVLIPAFVDTHQHMASFAAFHAGLNVMDAASNVEIAEMVKEFVATA